ncbi:hypothetical protein [Aestuariibacter salexigens]|uniref:hypothetical protein n=1 Tax=Aestuariibacter salexigens TaxID=226010 RepID=UPI000414877B|nr:hypothetical protein [Aestuariibacter salexigens]
METDSNELFREEVLKYKALRTALSAEEGLNDTEREWLLSVVRQEKLNRQKILELYLA